MAEQIRKPILNYINRNGLDPKLNALIFAAEIAEEERKGRFNDLWANVDIFLDTVSNDSDVKSVLTRQRPVTFEGSDAPYVLGFRASYGRDFEKVISAHWRRIYPEDVRLAHYESGECELTDTTIELHPDELERLEELFELYKNAPDYI